MRRNGSGAWVRRDRRETRFRTLRGTAPARHEITKRTTYCSVSQERLGEMGDFATSKTIAEELPGVTPRDIVTIFEFQRTSQKVSDSAVLVGDVPDVVPVVLRHVLR